MGDGTSIGKFNGLTTAGGGLFFDVLALLRNAGSLSRNSAALIANPDALSSNPEDLTFDPGALSFEPDALSFDADALSFDPDALSFEVFHQRLGSNGLVFSHLRGIAPKSSKFAFPNFQPLTPNSQ